MASILRTLIEQHDLSLPEAVSKIRTILEAEESEAGKTKTLNILAMLACGGGALASMTNPIGLALCAVAIGVNWSCQHAHRKDYGKIRDEQDLIRHAPLILDSIVQYYSANIATESTLLAAYEHCLTVFDEEAGICVSTAQIQGSSQFQTVEYLPVDYFRSSVQLALQQEDPVLRIAGKATGLNRMYERMGIEPPQEREIAPSIPVQPQAIAPQQISETTRLNAVNVPAQPVAQAKRPSALDALLASPYISRAIFGAQRTGKSYLAAVASQELSKDGTQIYHLNLASFGTEDDEYWNHATKSVRADLPSMTDPDDAVDLIERAIALVLEWFAQPNSVLIVDELAYLGSSSNTYTALLQPLLKIIADKIACLSSTGIKRRQAIWTIAPEFVAGGLTQDAKAIKKLQLCYVSIAPNKSVDWNGSRIGFNGELFEQIKNNFPITDAPVGLGSDRICFIDNKWMQVGELPKLCSNSSSKSSTPLSSVLLGQIKGSSGEKK